MNEDIFNAGQLFRLFGVKFIENSTDLDKDNKIVVKFTVPKKVIIDKELVKLSGYDTITSKELAEYVKKEYLKCINDNPDMYRFLYAVRDEEWDTANIIYNLMEIQNEQK